MSTTQLRIACAAALFVLIFLFGFWLSRSGKPYPAAVFTLHKLAGLGALALIWITAVRDNQAAPLTLAQWLPVALMTACFLALVVTGGLLSLDRAFPAFVQRLHQVVPYLAALSAAAALYGLPAVRAWLAPG